MYQISSFTCTTLLITELINTGAADRIISQKKEIAKERNLIYSTYFKISNPHESPISFFRWLPLEHKYQPKQFEQAMLAQGIRVYHSSRFLVRIEESKQFVRISLTSVTNSE